MNTTGQFFAVDRRVWAEVCSIGRINLAVAYLVLARGTLGDLRTTSWSVNAIESRTSVPRLAAKKAIRDLIEEGFVEEKRSGTKPKYYIKAYDAVCGARVPAPELRPIEKAVLSLIHQHPDGVIPPRSGGTRSGWPEGTPYTTATNLYHRGLLRRLPSGAYAKKEEEPSPPEWIWLPNSIVDGAANELPPLERIRQSQHLPSLRLYIELYHSQSLAIDGGLNWRLVRCTYHKKLLGTFGSFNIFAFWPDCFRAFEEAYFTKSFMTTRMSKNYQGKMVDSGWNDFFVALDILDLSGVIDIIPHAITADSEEGTVIHPLAQPGQGEEAERDLFIAAEAFGRTLLRGIGDNQTYRPDVIIFPAQRHMVNVTVVGLVRLRHRAKTRATAEWFERMDEWREAAERYRAHERAVLGEDEPLSGHATSTGHQR